MGARESLNGRENMAGRKVDFASPRLSAPGSPRMIQEPIGVIQNLSHIAYIEFIFFFRVFQESQGKREASVERGKRPLFVP